MFKSILAMFVLLSFASYVLFSFIASFVFLDFSMFSFMEWNKAARFFFALFIILCFMFSIGWHKERR